MRAIEELFNYKATTATNNDVSSHLMLGVSKLIQQMHQRKKRTEHQVKRHIDFTALDPSTINSPEPTGRLEVESQSGPSRHRERAKKTQSDDSDCDRPLPPKARYFHETRSTFSDGIASTLKSKHPTHTERHGEEGRDDEDDVDQRLSSQRRKVRSLDVHARIGSSRKPNNPEIPQTPKAARKAAQGTGQTGQISSISIKSSQAVPPSTPRRSAREQMARSRPADSSSFFDVPLLPSDLESSEESDEEPIEVQAPSLPAQSQLRKPSRHFTHSGATKSSKQVSYKPTLLSYDVTSGTKLKVIASSQQNMAPVTVRLTSYKPEDNLFDFLAAECELGPKVKVTAVSATYSWEQTPHRLRKHRLDEDWEVFCDTLRQAWERLPDPTKGGLEVTMLLHVEE